MRPVAALKLNPAGKLLAPKLVGLLVATIWKVKAEPTCALEVALMTAGGWTGTGETVRESVPVPVPRELVAVSPTENIPF